MKLEEIAAGGIWLASAVAVAGMTFEAYAAEWKGFPGISGGSNLPTSPPAKATQSAQDKKSFGPFSGVFGQGGWLETIVDAPLRALGLTSLIPHTLPQAELNRLNALKSPPKPYVDAIIAANKTPTKQGLPQAANKLLTWALQNQWTYNDVSNFLTYLGVSVIQ